MPCERVPAAAPNLGDGVGVDTVVGGTLAIRAVTCDHVRDAGPSGGVWFSPLELILPGVDVSLGEAPSELRLSRDSSPSEVSPPDSRLRGRLVDQSQY